MSALACANFCVAMLGAACLIFTILTGTRPPSRQAQQKSLALLRLWLSPEQAAPPPERRRVRNDHSRPLATALETWLRKQRAKLSAKNEVAKAIAYSLNRWSGLTRFLDDGRLCMSNNAAERALRCVAVGRHNWTFAGSDEGASYCSSDHLLINAAVFVGDYQAADVVSGVYWLHYVPTRSPSQLAG
jgi:hypothetical protein